MLSSSRHPSLPHDLPLSRTHTLVRGQILMKIVYYGRGNIAVSAALCWSSNADAATPQFTLDFSLPLCFCLICVFHFKSKWLINVIVLFTSYSVSIFGAEPSLLWCVLQLPGSICALNSMVCAVVYTALIGDTLEVSVGGHLLCLFSHFGFHALPVCWQCITQYGLNEVSKDCESLI